MFTKGGKNSHVKKFGLMAVLLVAGDSFHLIPRMYVLWTTGLEANAMALGIGKLITSVTMTVFYLTISMWILTVVRIALCLVPQNDWLSYQQPML